MRWQTHLAAGAAAAGLICHAMDTTGIRCCCVILGAAVGSLLPDIDTSESKISNSSNTASCISVLLEDGFGHRGLVHTPFFMVLLAGAFGLWYLEHISDGWGIGILLLGIGTLTGFALHLLLDMLTPYGIMLMYPFSRKRISIESKYRGRLGESHLFSLLYLFDILLYVVLC